MSLLDGVRIVEMGLWVAGPSASGILADWGADVVKIEQLDGDPMRNLFGAMSGSKESRCPPFEMHNRGKRSVALDVNHPEGAALAQRIVATSDVFLTKMRPDAQVQAVRAFVPVPAISGDGSTTMSVASPLDFSAAPVAPAKPPPQLGADTGAVLAGLGVDETELARLRQERVIG